MTLMHSPKKFGVPRHPDLETAINFKTPHLLTLEKILGGSGAHCIFNIIVSKVSKLLPKFVTYRLIDFQQFEAWTDEALFKV